MTDFRPYRVDRLPEIGDRLTVLALGATIPDRLLPATVRIHGTWRRVAGQTLRTYYADHDRGIIRLPVVPGDGEADLRQLVRWLEARGYRDTAAGPGEMTYARVSPA